MKDRYKAFVFHIVLFLNLFLKYKQSVLHMQNLN